MSDPHVLLNGHIDVVPADEPQLWTSPPFRPERRDGWLYGRGAGDMKGGLAMGILAVRGLLDPMVKAPLGPLTFVTAIEEECTGNGTLASVAANVVADAAIVLEPTDLGLLVGGIGVLWLEITVEGRAAHAEAAGSAVSAVDAALPVLEALRHLEDELAEHVDGRIDGERPLRVVVGGFRGGDWPSSVPSLARLDVRVGFPLGWTPADAEARTRAHLDAAAAADPWLAAHPPAVRASGFRAEGYDLPVDHPLTAAMASAHQDAHGARPEIFSMATTTDARIYLNRADMPAICYGPRVTAIHGIDEGVELASIVDGARSLARFLIDAPTGIRNR